MAHFLALAAMRWGKVDRLLRENAEITLEFGRSYPTHSSKSARLAAMGNFLVNA